MRVFLARPGWRPADLGGFVPPPEVERASHRPWDPPVPLWLALYAMAQLVLLLGLTTLFLHRFGRLEAGTRAAAAALGGLLEGRRWGHALEATRLASAGALMASMLWPLAPAAAVLGPVVFVALAMWLLLRALHPSRESWPAEGRNP